MKTHQHKWSTAEQRKQVLEAAERAYSELARKFPDWPECECDNSNAAVARRAAEQAWLESAARPVTAYERVKFARKVGG